MRYAAHPSRRAALSSGRACKVAANLTASFEFEFEQNRVGEPVDMRRPNVELALAAIQFDRPITAYDGIRRPCTLPTSNAAAALGGRCHKNSTATYVADVVELGELVNS